MPRTRDLAVMSATIVSLVAAIVAVLVSGSVPQLFQGATAFVATDDSMTASAELVESPQVSREDRVADLARKVAAYLKNNDIPESPIVAAEVAATTTEETDSETDVAVADQGEMRCVSYGRAGLDWNVRGLTVTESEGILLVYRERATTASSSEFASTRDMILELPLRGASQGMKHCVPNDVIGITQGGALIRNSDVGTYGVFGSSMLIGYALDGYPIYGVSSDKTDICGGRMVSGQYRYQLSRDRDTILNCFMGTPASL